MLRYSSAGVFVRSQIIPCPMWELEIQPCCVSARTRFTTACQSMWFETSSHLLQSASIIWLSSGFKNGSNVHVILKLFYQFSCFEPNYDAQIITSLFPSHVNIFRPISLSLWNFVDWITILYLIGVKLWFWQKPWTISCKSIFSFHCFLTCWTAQKLVTC